MKLAVQLLFVLLLAIGVAATGRALSFEGSRRLAEINARLRYGIVDPGPEFAIFKEPDGEITFTAYLFADLPTETDVYFSVPTIGFGRFLMFASVALLGLDVWWLRRRHRTNGLSQ